MNKEKMSFWQWFKSRGIRSYGAAFGVIGMVNWGFWSNLENMQSANHPSVLVIGGAIVTSSFLGMVYHMIDAFKRQR